MKQALGLALGLALLLASAPAALAQGGPGGPAAAPGPRTPPPAGANPFAGPRFPNRRGLTLGFGGGIGSMETSDIAGLGDDSLAGGVFGHVGWMLTPQLALVGEAFTALQSTGDNIGAGDVFLAQTGVFVAAQFWATPQLWFKGGVGGAFASFQDDAGIVEDIGSGDGGPALLLAAGFEVLHAPRFSLDVQFRFASATYDGVVDTRVSQGIFAIGFNWFLTPIIGVGTTAY